MDNIVTDVNQIEISKPSFKKFDRRKSHTQKALEFIHKSIVFLDTCNELPITTRAFGFAAVETFAVCREQYLHGVAPDNVWPFIRAAYIAKSVQLEFVHEHCNVDADFTRSGPSTKRLKCELESKKQPLIIKVLCDQIGTVLHDEIYYYPSIQNSWIVDSPSMEVDRADDDLQSSAVRRPVTVRESLPYPQELSARSWQRVVEVLQLDTVATFEYRKYFITHSPFHIPHVNFQITAATAELMLPGGTFDDDRMISDLSLVASVLERCPPNLSAYIVLDKAGTVGQLVKTEKHKIKAGVNQTAVDGYSVEVKFRGTVSDVNQTRIGLYSLLGEYPVDDGKYSPYSDIQFTSGAFIPWNQEFTRMCGSLV